MNRPGLLKGFTNIRFSCYFTGCCCMARDVPMSAPYFTTDGNTYKAQVGNSIQLLCQVSFRKQKCSFLHCKYQAVGFIFSSTYIMLFLNSEKNTLKFV